MPDKTEDDTHIIYVGSPFTISLKIHLDEVCWRCHGSGKTESGIKGHLQDCYLCNGNGIILTETGRTLLDFMNEWG